MNSEYKDVSEFAIGDKIQTFFGMVYTVISKSGDWIILKTENGKNIRATKSKKKCFKLVK
jgi:hypothetical protein